MKRPYETRTDSSGSGGSDEPKHKKDAATQNNIKIHSGFRIGPLVDIFGQFGEDKKRILRRMHFDGLLELPKGETKYDRPFKLQFAFWLLMKIDPETGILDLGKRGSFRIRDKDASLILGLLSEGDEIVEHDHSKLEQNQSIIKKNLMLHEHEELDLENIRKVLERHISTDKTEQDTNAFMTAATLYAVSFFLAPKGRPPKLNTEILDSITDPCRILRINWSSFVINKLKESSSKIQSDILAGKKTVCLDGCLLFLQIVYLDNTLLGHSRTNKWKLPRVAEFPYNKLKSLIIMDKNKTWHGTGDQYGNLQILDNSESIYTRGIENREKNKGTTKQKQAFKTSYDIDSVIRHIEKENSDHKRKVRKAAYDFGEEVCSSSDKHCDYLKSVVVTWMTGHLWSEAKNHNDNIDNYENQNIQSHGKKRFSQAHATQGATHNKEAGRKNELEKKPEFVNLTDSDDNEAACSTKRKFSDKDGIRCGTKTAAKRTPLAVRKARMSKYSAEGSYHSEDETGIAPPTGLYMENKTAEGCAAKAHGRTKHMACRHTKEKVIKQEEQYSEDSE